ncbi:flagellar biosynthesis protein FlhF [Spirochaetota bacterium]|nr:flagellar biosynthesis protein FlhF [Spirochaetota bacterium]
MPRYFEVIGATAKLAREKIKEHVGNLSIVKEEEILDPYWKWVGKWLGLKKKSYYRIIVSEYKVTSPFLPATPSHKESLPKESVSMRNSKKKNTERSKSRRRNSSHPTSKHVDKNTLRRVPVSADNLPPELPPATPERRETPSERNLMEKSLKNFFRSVTHLQKQESSQNQKQSELYTLFDYPIHEKKPPNNADRQPLAKNDNPLFTLQAPSEVEPSMTTVPHSPALARSLDLIAEKNECLPGLPRRSRIDSKVVYSKNAAKNTNSPIALKEKSFVVAPITATDYAPSAKPRAVITQQKNNISTAASPDVQTEAQLNLKVTTSNSKKRAKKIAVEDFLLRKDFSDEIIAEAIAMSYVRVLQNKEDKLALAETIAALISYKGDLRYDSRRRGEPKLVFMAGSTGVGKTTTLSKLAFEYSNTRKARIAIASCDLRRMGAFEQLKSFSDIIKVPLKKLEDKRSLLELYQQNPKTDLIFIDTPGCSTREEELIDEVSNIMYYLNAPKVIYWCVPAAARTCDLLLAYKNFNIKEDANLIFTKVDETTSLGSVLSLAYHSKLPVSYFCTGQDILNDFFVGSLEQVQQALIREWNVKGSS